MYITHLKQNFINLWAQIESILKGFNSAGFSDHRVWMEDIAEALLTCIYDSNFENLNKTNKYYKGFDLKSDHLDIIVQVTTSKKNATKENEYNNNVKDLIENNSSLENEISKQLKFILIFIGPANKKKGFKRDEINQICTFLDLVNEICDTRSKISLININTCFNNISEIINGTVLPCKYINYIAPALINCIKKINYFDTNLQFINVDTYEIENLYVYKSQNTVIIGYFIIDNLLEVIKHTEESNKQYFLQKLKKTINDFEYMTNIIILNLAAYNLNMSNRTLDCYTNGKNKELIQRRIKDDSYLRVNLQTKLPHQDYFILNSIRLAYNEPIIHI